MYRRKASLFQRPNNMKVKTGTTDRYMAIAAPLQAECKPIWAAVKPRISGPMEVAAKRVHFRRDLFTVVALV